jgi:hypothetical protein
MKSSLGTGFCSWPKLASASNRHVMALAVGPGCSPTHTRLPVVVQARRTKTGRVAIPSGPHLQGDSVRLYLSSFRVGEHPGRLLELVGDNRRTAVINNGLDALATDSRTQALREELARLREIGLTGEEVDLRDYFTATNGTELTRRLRR